ncbi:DUF3515 domain-containing protein [Micromonospora haikouensis]|uniref:DUF3515 domain-containing protein n=1 Tax=Micromonospora haikouensis TaxID=686309 RepID=UPI003791E4E0
MTVDANRRTKLIGTAIAAPFAIIASLATLSVMNPNATKPAATPQPSRSGGRIGATTPVPMTAPKLPPEQAQACLALISQLPAQLRDLPARRVSEGPEQNAAYGDPPLTIQCGGKDVELDPTAKIWIISDVCWYAEIGESSTVWQTLDRKVQVTVTIPAAYAPSGQASGQWAAALSAPLVSAMPSKPTRYDCGPA